MSDNEAPVESPAILRSKKKRWLAHKRTKVTASEVACILGADPNRHPADLFLEKTGQVETPEVEVMRWGKRMESAISDGYVAATGRRVHPEPEYELAIHPDFSWMGATLDRGVTCDGYSPDFPALPGPLAPDVLGALELKLTTDPTKWEAAPPLAYSLQLQTQMAVTGRKWGSLTACVSLFRPVVWYDALYDEELFRYIVPKLEEFHFYVQRRELPNDPAWFSPASLRHIWPTDSGETIDLPGDEVLTMVDEWEGFKGLKNDAERSAKAIEHKLRVMMGPATFGRLADGSSLKLKAETVKAEEQPRDSYTKRVLRRVRDERSR